MTGLWKTWMQVWCGAIVLFGVAFTGAAFAQTDGLTRLFYALIGAGLPDNFLEAPALRFSLAILGAVLIGWGLTILVLLRTGTHAPSQLWQGLTAAFVIWYALDSFVSVATGFPLNALSNTVILIAYLVPVFGSGVLTRRNQSA